MLSFHDFSCNRTVNRYRRIVPVTLVDVAGLVPGAHSGRGRGNQFLSDLANCDALIQVVDASGTTDIEGNPIGDGDVDAGYRGEILYFEKVRTGMRSSTTSINGGITATWSIPLDRTAIKECRKAMKNQNELYEASLAAKRLNYEMSRAKTCADNYKNGFRFVKGSEMAKICQDIELIEPANLQHTHKIK